MMMCIAWVISFTFVLRVMAGAVYGVSLGRALIFAHRAWLMVSVLVIYHIWAPPAFLPLMDAPPQNTSLDKCPCSPQWIDAHYAALEPFVMAVVLLSILMVALWFIVVGKNVKLSAFENELFFGLAVISVIQTILAFFFALSMALDQMRYICDQPVRYATPVLGSLLIIMGLFDVVLLTFLCTDTSDASEKENDNDQGTNSRESRHSELRRRGPFADIIISNTDDHTVLV
jgi:hypothetical protein